MPCSVCVYSTLSKLLARLEIVVITQPFPLVTRSKMYIYSVYCVTTRSNKRHY